MPKVWSKAMEYLGLDQRTGPPPQPDVDSTEYRVVDAPADNARLEAALNGLAADGWRLVQILPLPNGVSDDYEPLAGNVRLVMRRATAR